jgi:hypothetical protein
LGIRTNLLLDATEDGILWKESQNEENIEEMGLAVSHFKR